MFIDNYQRVGRGGYWGNDRGSYSGGIISNVEGWMHGPRGIRWEADLRRPYIDKNGRVAVTMNMGRTTLVKGEQVPIKEHRTLRELVTNHDISPPFTVNAATTLRKEEWIELDRRVLRAARYRLRAWADLAAANSYGGFSGMSKTILEYETMSDPGEAFVDMDGLTEGRADAPLFQLQGLPLPITHCDFWFSSRQLAESQNSGTPLNTMMGEAAGRRVAESIEKQTIGNNTGIIYGGASGVGGYGRTSQVYGYTNFPARLTKTNLHTPTGSNAGTILADVLAALDQIRLKKFFGPFTVYTSNDWDQYLDNDYVLTGGNVATQTLRNRLRSIPDITDVRRLDFLFSTVPASSTGPGGEGVATAANPFTLLFVQLTPDVCEAVNGLDLTTVQWEAVAGMRLNFKVMAIQVPRLRADHYSNCGILQATTS